jgi:general secretion pathway protein C
VDLLLRKYLWIVDLVIAGLCAVFLGRAAASAVEGSFLSKVNAPRPGARALRNQQETVYTKQTEDILKRNVFCSPCPPIIKPPEEAKGPEPAPEPQRTSLPLQLLAVNYAPPPWGFTWSTAVLRDTESKFVGPFKSGEKVKGATITGIDETRVHLDNSGKPEYVDLLEVEGAAQAAAPAPAATPTPTPAGGGDALSQELDRGIKKTGEHTYEIQRGTLEAVLGNMSLLSRSARIVPEIRDGKAAGFRLYSVRPDGPFAKIGMQNGDVISAINGLEITSPEKALEVYAKLKSASHLSVGLERNGQRITKDYGIR